MKTKIIRRIDALGRVIIPEELCSAVGIVEGTAVEVCPQSKGILIKPYDKNAKEENSQDDDRFVVRMTYEGETRNRLSLTTEQLNFLKWLEDNDWFDDDTKFEIEDTNLSIVKI
jgi:bifunctional DNA-binding transcriptional regulator/antitoxin component of YhaV-PrlF toxin-antitoxin module